MWCFPNVILQQMAARTDVDAQGDCEKEYEKDYSWLHCRNGTALREVARFCTLVQGFAYEVRAEDKGS